MTATTVGNIINGSLRLIGQLAEGEDPSPETAQDALVTFRDMVESMNNDSLMLPVISTNVVSLPANTASLTVGAGQDINMAWPPVVYDANFVRQNNVYPALDFPLTPIDAMQYNSIAAKTISSSYPRYLYAERTFPAMVLHFWPVPQQVLEFHFTTLSQLSVITSLTTTIDLPPGYNKMYRYNLAIELAGEFGVEPLPTVSRNAAKSKRSLHRVNDKDEIMNMPNSLVRNFYGSNIYLGDTT